MIQPELVLLLIAIAYAGGKVLVDALASGMSWTMLLLLAYLALLYVHGRMGLVRTAIPVFASSVASVFFALYGFGALRQERGGLSLSVDAALRFYAGVHAAVLLLLLVMVKRGRITSHWHRALTRRHHRARKDALTGAANQRGFDEALAEAWSAAAASQTSLSMLMIHVDYFEQFSDRYGRQNGDACLLRVSEVLRSALKETHVLARMNGKKFAVLLPAYGMQACFYLADQLRQEIARAAVAHEQSHWGLVTISVGCATMLPATGESCRRLPREAEDALHQAKERGHNRLMSPLLISPPLFAALPMENARGAESPREVAPADAKRLAKLTSILHSALG